MSVKQIYNASADEIVQAVLNSSAGCLIDGCSTEQHSFLVAGINPIETIQINEVNAEVSLQKFDEKLSNNQFAAFFTISYDFGLKLEKIPARPKEFQTFDEPDIFLAFFDASIIHNYKTQETFLAGNDEKFGEINSLIKESKQLKPKFDEPQRIRISSDFDQAEYESAVEEVKEYIRKGETYQVNLTRQILAESDAPFSPAFVFQNIRKNHPVPFASFLRRTKDAVVSASPELFFRIQDDKIIGSPIKGTRPRGRSPLEDKRLKEELLRSEKDFSENVMIVDLVRNDFGRICRFGSVHVEKLYEIEKYATLFHAVSTVSGRLRDGMSLSDCIKAVFPCGSITGAPKIRTMQIIDLLEKSARGLSMGAIGYFIPHPAIGAQIFGAQRILNCSVAIRTVVIKENQAIFKVGGGIVIDSVPELEYKETETKSKAILNSILAQHD
ncbi:MAG: aminodeoxychorismate synthase component I [Acidobacteria bacterium]|jgi:para-aminobenzoate synthetase component 1|nr:MAG: aminodeoxychorismate synthase component I [Acidobacteriota bacterium]GIU82832.1 MAG: aminodeoxychorismate/anthranilate synthase component I [Pyrinomonadaceae bacterium]